MGKWSKSEMKHLIIFLSILFLSTPLFGQETGALYLYKTSSGLVWESIGDDKVQPKYNGEIKNGKPEGIGDLTAYDGEKYVGEWKDGKKHGQGTFYYTDGGVYVGEWKYGKRHGQGTRTSPNGKLVGEYKDGKPWNAKGYDKERNIISKWVIGVKQK